VDAGPLGKLPATFAGTLPCPDCVGTHYTLRLFPEGAFYLRTTHLRSGEDVSQYDIGGWTFSSDRTSVVLRGGGEAPLLFALKNANTLRKLDLERGDIAAALPSELRRVPDAESFEPRLVMRGTYRLMADAAVFTECSTGQHWPVAQEADNAALERAYGGVRRSPGQSVLVSVEGRLAMRPKIDGDGLEPALVVERFIKAFPTETCGARFSSAQLEGTHWRLVRLDDEPVLGPPRLREAYIVFDGKAHRIAGSGGCNRLSGGYEINGASLRVPALAATRMACTVGMDIERGLMDALGKTRTWRVTGQALDLYAEGGALLARFEATAAK
jgi:copper homeostasis protein (lipoprotein)